jgi:hypothetical protein
MNRIRLLQVTTAALILGLTACSEAPPAPAAKAPVEKPEPVTGQTALFRMYQVARSWAPDCQVLKLNSVRLSEVPDTPGKSGAWEGTLVSPSLGASRSYTWSAIDNAETNLHKGVFQTGQQPYSPKGGNKSFLIAAVKTDTDAALEKARTKSADYDKKSPGKPITFLLEQTPKFPNPAWRVVWGESVGVSDFSVFIDASTGDFLTIMH